MSGAKEAAVKACQMYSGSMICSVRDQQKLYRRMQRAVERLATKSGLTYVDTFEQVVREARRRGSVAPRLGKDV